MKICILTPRYPFPENGGDVLRINGIAKYLKSKGHQIVLVSFINKNQIVSDLDFSLYDKIYTVSFNKIVSLVNSLKYFLSGKPIQCGYYYSGKFNKTFKKVIQQENPDLFVSHLIRMETYLHKNSLADKSIIEMTDALSKTYGLSSKAKGFSVKKLIYKIEKNRIAKKEQQIISSYPKVVLVSENDIKYLGCQNSLCYHTNGINLYNGKNEYNSEKICFVGNMRTLQNQDAVLSFVKNIFPLIKKEKPGAKFYIVGAQPPASIMELANSSDIFVTGFVDSVEEFIQDACMIVAPVNIAAGIQNKVLIGMACNVPVVLTSLIAGAIKELESGKNCFIEDDYSEFANKCLLLMNDSLTRNKIAQKGFDLVKENYSWNKVLEGYEEI